MVLATMNRHTLHGNSKSVPIEALSKEIVPEESLPQYAPVIPRQLATRSEMIAFKDNAVGEIRIKFL
jgi:hypothetical protein